MTEQTKESTEAIESEAVEAVEVAESTETDNTETSTEITTEITAETLPLDVREHLMRGQQQSAVKILTETYDIDEEAAEAMIEDYREALRERKIALDIQMLHEKSAEEAKEKQQQIITWSVRIILLIFTIAMIYLLTGGPIK